MSLRISEVLAAAGALLALAACDPGPVKTKAELAQDARAQAARDTAEGRIPCALGGGDAFTTRCTIDRAQTQDGLMLTIRHPDGGFHRLRVTRDGRGVIAADGAQAARVTIIDSNAIEVAIDDARYRLPATVKGADRR
ncbi:hypothetical protein J2Y54_000478 [Sphingomonas sp. BE123]|jgi:hypothetical protein|uniref:hypothetical protein n=1 Tax=unclassified Sphingomonas TaxID=196159 RepID=UPI002861A5AB|nr:hypothetical protein [Sphingomonas sp. BE123]MDR6850985.1 hypothetical protein [Sphingomonas sp. BE123]